MLLLLVTADTQREYEKIRVQARIACGVGGGEQVWASFDQEEEKEEEEKQEEEKEEDSQVQVRRCHHMGEKAHLRQAACHSRCSSKMYWTPSKGQWTAEDDKPSCGGSPGTQTVSYQQRGIGSRKKRVSRTVSQATTTPFPLFHPKPRPSNEGVLPIR